MDIQGALVPIVTPFTPRGAIDYSALSALIDHLLSAGIQGIVVCGTTGEYYALSPDERHKLMATIAKKVGDKALLIAGVNDTYTEGSIAKALQAQALGYQCLMLAPPTYCLPKQNEIIYHYQTVSQKVDMPIIMYNYPARSGVEISIGAATTLSSDPNIIGIKESSGDFSRALTLLTAGLEDFHVICGSDDAAADYLFWGARSWISGATNYLAKSHVTMIKSAVAGNFTHMRELMATMLPVIQNMESADYNQKVKLGCAHIGFPVGDVRPPLLPINEADKKVFIDALNFALN